MRVAMNVDAFALLRRIDQLNAPRIAARLAEPHLGPAEYMERSYESVKYNNHSATTDADLQALIDDTISALEEEDRYRQAPIPTPALDKELLHA